MAFIGSKANPKSFERQQRETKIKQLAESKLAKEPKLYIPSTPHTIRASDIKGVCPRQTYYSREAERTRGAKGPDQVNASAIFGSTLHSLFEIGAPTEYETFRSMFFHHLEDEGWEEGGATEIRWKATAKPFSLAGFLNANLEEKINALWFRYCALDRENYLAFWETWPVAVYRFPETGMLAREQRLRGTIEGSEIVTTADLLVTDVYTAEIMPVDWKTGTPSEASQLATYAIIAEQQFGLEPGSITRGLFVCTGIGDTIAPRGGLPTAYIPQPENSVFVEELAKWRADIPARVRQLQKREERGSWPPVLNGLCYSACNFRLKCPMGQAVAEIEGEDGAS